MMHNKPLFLFFKYKIPIQHRLPPYSIIYPLSLPILLFLYTEKNPRLTKHKSGKKITIKPKLDFRCIKLAAVA